MNDGNEVDDQEVFPTCSVCKFQRRRCEQDCMYVQYFPVERFEEYLNVHALFGLNTAMKIINSVDAEDRAKTVETLFVEARLRKEYPVLGPVQVEIELQAQIQSSQKELEMIRKQIEFLRGNEGTSKSRH